MTTIYSSRRFISSESIRAGALVVQRFYERENKKRALVAAYCLNILSLKSGLTSYKLVRLVMKKTDTTNAMAASVIRELMAEGKIKEDSHSAVVSLIQ